MKKKITCLINNHKLTLRRGRQGEGVIVTNIAEIESTTSTHATDTNSIDKASSKKVILSLHDQMQSSK